MKKEIIDYTVELKTIENRVVEIEDICNFYLKGYKEDDVQLGNYTYFTVITEKNNTKLISIKLDYTIKNDKVKIEVVSIDTDIDKIVKEAQKYLKKQEDVLVISNKTFWKELSELLMDDVGLEMLKAKIEKE